MCVPEDILAFWFEELGPEKWYFAGDEVDHMCRSRFEKDWNALMEGKLENWQSRSDYSLAYVILADQLPRNMFRGQAKAFASDARARHAAKIAIVNGWDKKQTPERRQFFYLPLMHSENLLDQDRAVRMNLITNPDDHEQILHACAHRDIIRKYGRFPFRNEALGRSNTEEETEFLAAGGYAPFLRQMRDARAAA